MRSLIFSLLLTSFSALACPDLSGGYLQCRSSTGTVDEAHDVIIQQKKIAGVTSYFFRFKYEGEESERFWIKADGKDIRTEKPWGEDGQEINVSNLNCRDNSLVFINKSIIIRPDGFSRSEVMKTVMTKSGNQLKMVISGTSWGYPVSDELNCE